MRTTVIALLLLSLAVGASAGDRYPQGRWMVGGDTVHSIIDDDGRSDLAVEEEASGGAFQLGYMIQPRIQVRIYAAGAEHATSLEGIDLEYDGATIDIVYLFRPGTSFRPYLAGGAGGFGATSQQGPLKLESEGPGVALGAGCHLYVNRHLGFHAQARLESINWDTARTTLQKPGGGTTVDETPLDGSESVFRLSVGGTLWF